MNEESSDRAKLADISGKLNEYKAIETAKASRDADLQREGDNMNTGARAGAELVTCIIAGGGIGWLLDGYFHSKPLCLILFFMLGIAVGFWEVYRITQKIGHSVGFAELQKAKKTATNPPEDE